VTVFMSGMFAVVRRRHDSKVTHVRHCVNAIYTASKAVSYYHLKWLSKVV